MDVLTIGVFCFGLMIGFLTYRTLIRTTAQAAVSDLASVIAAVGGGGVTAIVDPRSNLFGWYAIALLIGFVLYGAAFAKLNGGDEFAKVMSLENREKAQRGPNQPKQ